MPIYAFQCQACGHSFDRLQKLSDPDPEQCPQCGQTQVRRQVTAPSFRLAGSGWYETDFKKEGDKKRNLAENKQAGDTSGKSEASSSGDKSSSTSDSGKSSKTSSTSSGSSATSD